MILLDTDHLSALKYSDTERGRRLVERLAAVAGEVIGTTVVSVEEQMRGWLAAIAKEKSPRRQVGPCRELAGLFAFFHRFHIALFDEAAVTRFEQLSRVRIGVMDRRIAAVALANDALLLTANRKDFEQVPGLRFENWMDEPPTPPVPPPP